MNVDIAIQYAASRHVRSSEVTLTLEAGVWLLDVTHTYDMDEPM